MNKFGDFPDEYHKMKRKENIENIIDGIVGGLIVIILLWILWPKDVDALVYKGQYTEFDAKPAYIEENYDNQKTLDIWKHNVKVEYITKSLTLQNTIWRYLTDEMGLSNECAAGIFGNMMVECGSRSFNLQPYVYSPGGYYYGLCQWGTTGHHSSVSGVGLEEQLLYLQTNISSEMGEGNYTRFCNASTPEEAANIFGQWYERCAEPYGRQQEARRAYERFGTGET